MNVRDISIGELAERVIKNFSEKIIGIKLGPRKGLDNYLEAPVKVSLLNDSVNIRFRKYFTNSKSPSSYVITH